MCTHISNMALDGGAWLASRPGFFVPRNEPRYLLDKRLLRPRAALDIVALQMFNQKRRSKMSARLFDLAYIFKNNTRKCNKRQTFLNHTINSVEHSHPRQINSQLPHQENVFYGFLSVTTLFNRRRPPTSVLCQADPVYSIITYFKFDFNIIIPSTPRFFKGLFVQPFRLMCT
jgi:hypothetical protein